MENKTIAIVLTVSICLNVFLGLALIGYDEMLDERDDLVIEWCEYSNDLVSLSNTILEEHYPDIELQQYIECWVG